MRKSVVMLLGVLAVVAILWTGHGIGAQPGAAGAPAALSPASAVKIGVLSMERVINSSRKNADHMKEANAEQGKLNAELQALAREVDSDQAQLKTLMPGSDDYIEQLKGAVEKQAKLQSLQEYYTQRAQAKEKQWAEQLYKEILQVTQLIAEQKGLTLVLERTEPSFPISADRLLTTIRTHKVLYTKDSPDITDEVLAEIDKK